MDTQTAPTNELPCKATIVWINKNSGDTEFDVFYGKNRAEVDLDFRCFGELVRLNMPNSHIAHESIRRMSHILQINYIRDSDENQNPADMQSQFRAASIRC